MKKRGNICGVLLLILIEIILMGACIRTGTFATPPRDTSFMDSISSIAMHLPK